MFFMELDKSALYHKTFYPEMAISRPHLNDWPTDSLTHSLTPWSRVLLEKLIITQLEHKCSAFYRTWRFILGSQGPSEFEALCNILQQASSLWWGVVSPLAQTSSWRTTPCLVATAYSIYLQVLSISGGCLQRMHNALIFL
jgi:hypothetical protein